jgi:hypothetical protein
MTTNTTKQFADELVGTVLESTCQHEKDMIARQLDVLQKANCSTPEQAILYRVYQCSLTVRELIAHYSRHLSGKVSVAGTLADWKPFSALPLILANVIGILCAALGFVLGKVF